MKPALAEIVYSLPVASVGGCRGTVGCRPTPGDDLTGFVSVEKQATIGDGGLAIEGCLCDAARETVEIFTSLANELCSAA